MKNVDMYQDIVLMHETFGVYDAIKGYDKEQLEKLLGFRMAMLREEYEETRQGYIDDEPEAMVDGLIDLIVIAIGTLDLFEVDVNVAWQEVMRANMSKEVGIKPERPNPLGLPDLIKPKGWEEPHHLDNLGRIEYACLEDD